MLEPNILRVVFPEILLIFLYRLAQIVKDLLNPGSASRRRMDVFSASGNSSIRSAIVFSGAAVLTIGFCCSFVAGFCCFAAGFSGFTAGVSVLDGAGFTAVWDVAGGLDGLSADFSPCCNAVSMKGERPVADDAPLESGVLFGSFGSAFASPLGAVCFVSAAGFFCSALGVSLGAVSSFLGSTTGDFAAGFWSAFGLGLGSSAFLMLLAWLGACWFAGRRGGGI